MQPAQKFNSFTNFDSSFRPRDSLNPIRSVSDILSEGRQADKNGKWCCFDTSKFEKCGRATNQEKFKRMACNTFVFSGACPYHDRCVFMHDFRVRADKVGVLPARQTRSYPAVKDTFYWPDMSCNELYRQCNAEQPLSSQQKYVIPDAFGSTHSNFHNRGIYSIWNHFVEFCIHNRRLQSQSACFNEDSFFQISDYLQNRHIPGTQRLTVFVHLSVMKETMTSNEGGLRFQQVAFPRLVLPLPVCTYKQHEDSDDNERSTAKSSCNQISLLLPAAPPVHSEHVRWLERRTLCDTSRSSTVRTHNMSSKSLPTSFSNSKTATTSFLAPAAPNHHEHVAWLDLRCVSAAGGTAASSFVNDAATASTYNIPPVATPTSGCLFPSMVSKGSVSSLKASEEIGLTKQTLRALNGYTSTHTKDVQFKLLGSREEVNAERICPKNVQSINVDDNDGEGTDDYETCSNFSSSSSSSVGSDVCGVNLDNDNEWCCFDSRATTSWNSNQPASSLAAIKRQTATSSPLQAAISSRPAEDNFDTVCSKVPASKAFESFRSTNTNATGTTSASSCTWLSLQISIDDPDDDYNIDCVKGSGYCDSSVKSESTDKKTFLSGSEREKSNHSAIRSSYNASRETHVKHQKRQQYRNLVKLSHNPWEQLNSCYSSGSGIATEDDI